MIISSLLSLVYNNFLFFSSSTTTPPPPLSPLPLLALHSIMNLCSLCCCPPLPRSCELRVHSLTHTRWVVVLVSVWPQSLGPFRQKLHVVELSIPLAVKNLVYPSLSGSSPSSLSCMGVLPCSNAIFGRVTPAPPETCRGLM